MQPLTITFKSPHLSNPRQQADPQPDGTLKILLVVDCDLDLQGDGSAGTPLAAAMEETSEVIANYPFDGVKYCQVQNDESPPTPEDERAS